MLLSVSVDLDEIRHYARLHGLDAHEEGLVYSRAVPRLCSWARERGMPLTWFVVGRDLNRASNAEVMARVAAEGDELGCHTLSHPYDLTLRSFAEMRAEVEQGVVAIERVARAKVRGFRAPGYVVNDALLDLLRETGLEYDSSVFPCPSYYALKSAALAAIRARGAHSVAIVGSPDALRAPTVPYRVGRPYWFRGTGIWEIPIQVTRRARLPFIGTALTLAGSVGARLLARGVVGEPFVNLELHGLDALDENDGLSNLAKHQCDLRIPWARKLASIAAAVGVLRASGYACVRMDELAHAAALA
jgi:peptidoglycan-N-acetylglucosamine deacetylase